MVNQSDYIYTLNHHNEKLRQEFIDEIDLGETRNFVSQVKYSPKIDTSSYQNWTAEKVMQVSPHPLTFLRIKGKKARIDIYPSAFSHIYQPKLEDFLVRLIHHEGYHAKEMFEEPKKIIANRIKRWFDCNVYNLAFTRNLEQKFYERVEEHQKFAVKYELRAYNNELEKALISGCSEKHIENIRWEIRLREIALH